MPSLDCVFKITIISKVLYKQLTGPVDVGGSVPFSPAK